MKQTTASLATLFVVSTLALAGANIVYALWSETLTINGSITTTELDWEYLDPTTGLPSYTQGDIGPDPFSDGTYGKDVASTTGEFFDTDGDGDYDTLEVTVDTAYPRYYNDISFWVHCNGHLPLHIDHVNFVVDGTVVETITATGDVYLDLDGDGQDDIRIYWGNNFGLQMHYCDYVMLSFAFEILQQAPQGETLTFAIEIVGVQYNEA